LLRYREHFLEKKRILEKKGNKIRPLLIGFEEPEIYLHPNAANNMRDEIYALAISSNSQIVCTTHSPYMIDLGKDLDLPDTPRQVLNLLKLDKFEDDCYESTLITAFNTTEAYKKLITDEKDRVKFVLKLDDYVARIFFVRNIIIVEGDTEDIVLKETIKRMPDRERKIIQSDFQIIKARGKATIIALVKYLISMGLTPFVIHDKDEIEGATKYNKPILDALGSEDYRIMLDNCIEDVLGYKAPSSNKPFIAFEYIQKNWLDSKWENVGIKWKEIVTKKVFPQVFK
ncbi:AAA family ATPase, partial [Leeuwenhoekiella sp.]|uniref:ATP-dependent nuclease n=1 Tax=Leeuwenhoekiella sp. TaxID=1977054 RepID=UPI0025BCC9AD